MRIYVDMDETTFDLIPVLLAKYNMKYNDNLKFTDITDYSIHKFLKPDCTNIFQEFATDDTILNLKVKHGAVEVLTKLTEQYNEIYFLTAGHPKTMAARDELLYHTFKWYSSGQLIMCRNKQLLKKGVLIDDHIMNLLHSDSIKILFSAPWNFDFPEDTFKMARVGDWFEIEELLKNKK